MTDALLNWKTGVLFGVLGMLGFSGTPVATRLAVSDFSPLAITSGRIVIAAVLAILALQYSKALRFPEKSQLPSLLWMGVGLAVGYPLFLAIALQGVPAVHGAVVAGLAPVATAIIAVIRNGERMSISFWAGSILGFLSVLYFAIDAGGGHIDLENLWLLLAIVCLGISYVEGGRASTEMGATIALSWAMLLLSPGAAILLVYSVWDINFSSVTYSSWLGLAYLGGISMFLASVFWYRGLAAGGTARIGQINLFMPIAALVWSALFLGEHVSKTAVVCAVFVSIAMVVCVRSRVRKLR